MSKGSLFIFVIIFVAVSAQTSDTQLSNKPIECFTQAYTSNSTAFVTCVFPLDVKEQRQDFSLHYFAPDQSETDLVFSCYWKNAIDDKTLHCGGKDGYTLAIGDISKTVTVQVPFRAVQPGAKFRCKLSPNIDSSPCKFESIPLADGSKDENNGLGKDVGCQSIVVVVLAAVSSGLFCALVGIFSTICFYRRKLKKLKAKQRNDKKNPDTVQLLVHGSGNCGKSMGTTTDNPHPRLRANTDVSQEKRNQNTAQLLVVGSGNCGKSMESFVSSSGLGTSMGTIDSV